MGWITKRLDRLLAVIFVALYFAAGVARLDLASEEALTREAICMRLLANTADGRQGLVSSVWWAPLPTLLRLPAVFLWPSPQPLASAYQRKRRRSR